MPLMQALSRNGCMAAFHGPLYFRKRAFGWCDRLRPLLNHFRHSLKYGQSAEPLFADSTDLIGFESTQEPLSDVTTSKTMMNCSSLLKAMWTLRSVKKQRM